MEFLHIAIALVAGHLLGDFLLQSNLMVAQKKHVGVLFVHACIVTLLTYLLCGAWLCWQLVIGVFFSHFFIDGIKVAANNDGAKAFLADQSAHFLILLFIACYWVPASVQPFWLSVVPFYSKSLLLLSGAFVTIQVGGYWVGKAVAGFQGALGAGTGLPHAGRLIGQLERALIYLLVLASQTQGVGFLVTAKSILRFGEIKDSGQQKEAEYIIIGTLMSFGWALAVSYGVQFVWTLI